MCNAKMIPVLAVLVMAWGLSPVDAATSTTIATSATVTGVLQLESFLFKGVEWLSAPVTNMNFGNLIQDAPNGALRGSDWYTMLVYVHSSMRPYRVSSSGVRLTKGADSIPAGACVMTPAGALPIVSPSGSSTPNPLGTVGACASFVGSDKPIYTCTNGVSAEIHVTYAITNDYALGAREFVSPDQPMGAYSGTITVSVALT